MLSPKSMRKLLTLGGVAATTASNIGFKIMSLLQRLNERAQALKGEQNNEVATKDSRKQRFQNETMPAMQNLERFLRELNQQLKQLRPSVRQSFEIAGYGNFDAIPNFDWLFVPGESRLNEYTLEVRWKSRVDTEKATRLTLNSYDRVRAVSETFKRLHLGGIREEKRAPTGLIVQASVQATGYINSKLNIRAHIEEDVVHFLFENVDQLALVKRQLGAEFMGPEVFDRLGEFILRENDLFVREHWVRSLKPVEHKSAPEVVAAPPVPAVVEKPAEVAKIESVSAAAQLESAQDRELDFLAELKFAARYADSAVKKNISMEGDNGFGQERDSASLRSAYNRLSTPKLEKLSPFASGLEPDESKPAELKPAELKPASIAAATPVAKSAPVQTPTTPVPSALQKPAVASLPQKAATPPAQNAAAPSPAQQNVVPTPPVQQPAANPAPTPKPALESLQNPEVSRALGLLARMLGTKNALDKL